MPQNKDLDKIYYLFQDSNCKHWFRDNADMLYLATYLIENGIGIKEKCPMGCPGTLSKYDLTR